MRLRSALPFRRHLPDLEQRLEQSLVRLSRPVSVPSLTAKAEIGDGSIETKSVGLGDCYFYPHDDAAQPVPTTRDASDEASNPALVTQDFRYLTYYVWSELPPTENRRISS